MIVIDPTNPAQLRSMEQQLVHYDLADAPTHGLEAAVIMDVDRVVVIDRDLDCDDELEVLEIAHMPVQEGRIDAVAVRLLAWAARILSFAATGEAGGVWGSPPDATVIAAQRALARSGATATPNRNTYGGVDKVMIACELAFDRTTRTLLVDVVIEG